MLRRGERGGQGRGAEQREGGRNAVLYRAVLCYNVKCWGGEGREGKGREGERSALERRGGELSRVK